MNSEERILKTTKIVNAGLIANIVLSVTKMLAGVIGSSQALLADGINSISDVVYYIVVKIFIHFSKAPPDPEHPYGHTQLESIAALVVGAFVTTTGITILINSITSVIELTSGQIESAGTSLFTLWVGLAAIIIKIILSIFTFRFAKQTKSAAVVAMAQDHRNDVIATSGAVIGILLSELGFRWVDPLAGALVSLVIIYTGINILRESSADLMDTIPGQALAKKIVEVLKPIKAIKTIEEIHAHRFGPYFVVNLTIGLDGSSSIKEGDDVATCVENTLYEELDYVRKVYVHYHPATMNPNLDKGTAGINITT